MLDAELALAVMLLFLFPSCQVSYPNLMSLGQHGRLVDHTIFCHFTL